ncbi:hypothetical protein [Flagellimonas sp.]|uniref:hypothetical protein n=1 Tax=Flagellimonas sp. TaxID=2058762 RepID=UPI003B58C9AB
MKFNIPSKSLITFVICLFLFYSYSQETTIQAKEAVEKAIEQANLAKQAYINKRAEEEYKHIESAFLDMFRKANANYVNANAQTCDPFSYVKNLKEDKYVTEGFKSETNYRFQGMFELFLDENRSNLIGSLLDKNKKNLEVEVDKDSFKTLLDKLLSTSSNSKDFIDFISLFTGKSIGDLSKNDLEYLRAQYDKSKGLRAAHLYSAYQYEDYIEYPRKDCSVSVKNSIRETKNKYPNSEWLFTSVIDYDCGCQEGSNQSTLSTAVYKYTGKVTSLSTATNIVFNTSVSNPKLSISNVVCCPEKKEEDSKTSTDEVNFDYDWSGDGFSITVGAGPTIGDEADFFGLTYSAGIGYYQSLTEDFQIGATAGYSRYTGKETDFGFETEGESFIPVMAKASYGFSDVFGAEAGLGYAISTSEGGEGGLTYSVGPFWRPLETVIITINYVNISFGEGSLGAFVLSGRVSLSKK